MMGSLMIWGFTGLAQEPETTPQKGNFRATVINAQTDRPLESVHVINLNQVVGTITDQKGNFSKKCYCNNYWNR